MLNELSNDLITISSNLQSPKIDLIECCRQVTNLRDRLIRLRDDKQVFERIYNGAMESKSFEQLQVVRVHWVINETLQKLGCT